MDDNKDEPKPDSTPAGPKPQADRPKPPPIRADPDLRVQIKEGGPGAKRKGR